MDSDYALSDDTLLKENPNEFINFTAKDGDFDEHITIPKEDLQDAHYSAYEDGDALGHEPLDF